MKTLYLCRHAKSDWHQGSSDFDRPLNERGLRNAPAQGALLAKQQPKIDMIVSSPAMRALTTAQLVATELNFDKSHIIQESLLYNADYQTILDVIYSLDDNHQHVMIFGHNPGISYIANYLAASVLGDFASGTIAGLQFDNETWQLTQHSGHKLFFEFPEKH